ncbi:hypothetical protein INT48_002057 [Thamnidium elegans]|uniref:Uncharacterized protein n=1 Tax=Thamnidium elegans TaxID=101142 RepID=A0A8H7SYX5_9FUNG|nr:hypothetical protein INT48_002057 [Thamnidium elegans]
MPCMFSSGFNNNPFSQPTASIQPAAFGKQFVQPAASSQPAPSSYQFGQPAASSKQFEAFGQTNVSNSPFGGFSQPAAPSSSFEGFLQPKPSNSLYGGGSQPDTSSQESMFGTANTSFGQTASNTPAFNTSSFSFTPSKSQPENTFSFSAGSGQFGSKASQKYQPYFPKNGSENTV